ncbi:MAG: hypothetical protein N4A47_04560 [Clostridia bacterium]|jgi:hypothetical protein|nr:hypothetical protein [Clostridia bacterium]
MKKIITMVMMFAASFIFANANTYEDYKVNVNVAKDNKYYVEESFNVYSLEEKIKVKNKYGFDYVNVISKNNNYKDLEFTNIIVKPKKQNDEAINEYELSYTIEKGSVDNKEIRFKLGPFDKGVNNLNVSLSLAKPIELKNVKVLINGYKITKGFYYKDRRFSLIIPSLQKSDSVEIKIKDKDYFIKEDQFLKTKIYAAIFIIVIFIILYFINREKNGAIGTKAKTLEEEYISPFYITYFSRKDIKSLDLINQMIYWANNGYVKIYEKEDGYVFSKIKAPKDNMFEEIVFDEVFGHQNEINSVDIEKAIHHIKRHLDIRVEKYFNNDANKIHVFSENIYKLIEYVLIFVATTYIMSGYINMYQEVNMIIAGAVIAVGSVCIPIKRINRDEIAKEIIEVISFYIIFKILFGIHTIDYLIIIAAGNLIYVMLKAMDAYTYLGEKKNEEIIGFKKYLETLEVDEFELKYLPFLRTFDIEKEFLSRINIEKPVWFDVKEYDKNEILELSEGKVKR